MCVMVILETSIHHHHLSLPQMTRATAHNHSPKSARALQEHVSLFDIILIDFVAFPSTRQLKFSDRAAHISHHKGTRTTHTVRRIQIACHNPNLFCQFFRILWKPINVTRLMMQTILSCPPCLYTLSHAFAKTHGLTLSCDWSNQSRTEF